MHQAKLWRRPTNQNLFDKLVQPNDEYRHGLHTSIQPNQELDNRILESMPSQWLKGVDPNQAHS